MQKPELRSRHFFQQTADGADKIVRGEKCKVIDADDGGGEGSGCDARVERKRHGKDVREANAVEHVEGDEPADRDFCSRTCRDRRASCERDDPGYSDKAADTDLDDLGRFWKFFRPQPPEHDCADEKTYRHDRVERDEPGGRHFFTEENQIYVSLGPEEIRSEDLMVADDPHGDHW